MPQHCLGPFSKKRLLPRQCMCVCVPIQNFTFSEQFTVICTLLFNLVQMYIYFNRCKLFKLMTPKIIIMYGRKRSVRRYNSYRGSRDKYSMENRFIEIVPTDQGTELVETKVRYQGIYTIVPATTVQGMRKVKHITLQIQSSGTAPIYFVVVYVPVAQSPNLIGLNAYPNMLYEPSQYVMGAGHIDPDGGQNRIRIPIARNLNEGDQIALLTGQAAASINIQGIATYAITYN